MTAAYTLQPLDPLGLAIAALETRQWAIMLLDVHCPLDRINRIAMPPTEEVEDRNIKERQLKSYGLAALEVGAAVDAVKVVFTQFRSALEACDRIYELSKAFDIPQGMVVTGPPGASKTTLATYFIKSLPDADLVDRGFGAIAVRLRNSPSQGHIVSGLLHALKYPFTHVKRGRVTSQIYQACAAFSTSRSLNA